MTIVCSELFTPELLGCLLIDIFIPLAGKNLGAMVSIAYAWRFDASLIIMVWSFHYVQRLLLPFLLKRCSPSAALDLDCRTCAVPALILRAPGGNFRLSYTLRHNSLDASSSCSAVGTGKDVLHKCYSHPSDFEMCVSAGAGYFGVVPCPVHLFSTNCGRVSSVSSVGSEF